MAATRKRPARPVTAKRMNAIRAALGPLVAELRQTRNERGRPLSHVEIQTRVAEHFASHGDGTLPSPQQWRALWRRLAP